MEKRQEVIRRQVELVTQAVKLRRDLRVYLESKKMAVVVYSDGSTNRAVLREDGKIDFKLRDGTWSVFNTIKPEWYSYFFENGVCPEPYLHEEVR